MIHERNANDAPFRCCASLCEHLNERTVRLRSEASSGEEDFFAPAHSNILNINCDLAFASQSPNLHHCFKVSHELFNELLLMSLRRPEAASCSKG
jgi:hypothetical protein